MKTKTIYFGIGCFHFGVSQNEAFEDIDETYVAEIEKLLNSLPVINNIDIKKYRAYRYTNFHGYYIDFEYHEDPYNFNRYNGINPHPIDLEVSFKIYIPHRIQQEISIQEPKTYTENFDVRIIYNDNFPIAFIELIDPTSDNCDPSNAVQIIREYLKRNLNQTGNIKFMNMGPSPFHAVFSISLESLVTDEKWDIKHNVFQLRGYKLHSFICNDQQYVQINDAKDNLYNLIAQELGFYYYLTQINNRRSNKWEIINDNINELIKLQNGNAWRYFINYFNTSKILNAMFYNITEFEKDEILYSQILKSEFKSLYLNSTKGFFKESNNEILQDSINYPTKQFINLINLFEQRRLKFTEIVAVITSAVLGGLIGSIITITFSG